MATFVATNRNTMSNLLMSYRKPNIQNPFVPTFAFKLEDNNPFVAMECSGTSVGGSGQQVQRKLSKGESIHSGHFMVSEIEENESTNKQTATESDYEREEDARILSSYEFQAKENTQTYVYGSKANSCVQIDSSLTKLFECMSLAYNGKITSPKWKTFKGLKLHIKDKIRLNNIIWRAWHIQYIAGRNPVVCQFSSSVDSKRHKRTEAILLEGKYWKRRVDAVKAEYKKWRMYHRRGGPPRTPSRPSDFDWELSLPRWSTNLSNLDSLFSCEESADFFPTNYINAQNSFGNYYDYNSREIARSGMGAQFMQPGLEQLQPNVDFMDTFEPLHEAISRFHNNFALPTVQEESVNFDSNNKEEELFNSLFPQSNDQAPGAIESAMSKPMLESANTYGEQNVFQTHNEMLNLNAKLDDNNLLAEPQPALPPPQQQQQQQLQSQPMQDSFGAINKLDLSNNYNYSNQMMQTNSVGFGPMHESVTVSQQQQQQQQQLNQVQLKPQVSMDTLYSNKLTFEVNSTGSNSGNASGLMSMSGSVRGDTSSFVSRFQQVSQVGSNTTEPQPPPQSSQINVFQPEVNMLYGAEQHQQQHSNITSKNTKNTKYFPSYYQNSMAHHSSIDKQHQFTTSHHQPPPHHPHHSAEMVAKGTSSSSGGGGGGSQSGSSRSRSKSISMPHAKSITIKSLLNKPSLVSTMSQNESLMTNTFRVPNQSETMRTSTMERSLSLPIYTQDRQRKSGINGQLQLLQRLQNSTESNQPASTSQFDVSNINKSNNDGNYSFDSSINTFYPNSTCLSAATSPMSSHSSSYSNQDSQLLPPVVASNTSSSVSSPQIRKISQSSLDYVGSKALPDNSQQLGLAGMSAGDNNLSFSSSGQQTPSLISNLLQVNQAGVFSPHTCTSSSSSSPIGSLDSIATKVNLTSSSLGSVSFGAVNKTNRFKTDFNDQAHELKRNLKKPTNLFGPLEFATSKEKMLPPDGLSSAFATSAAELSLPSGSALSPIRKMSPRELSFKHMPSGPISPNALGSIGLSIKSEDRSMYKERRRVCHINAEQKRRCNIKNGFDTLRNLLPSLSSNANTKISKAAMLQKAADYIRILKNEKYEQQKEYEMLKQQVESLNQTISVFQNQLPATGAPLMGQRSSQIKEQYADYVQSRTMQNWKFWVFSIIMESLLDSYFNTVATSNFDEMCKTLLRWLDQSCCLITLRRDVLNSLRFISTSTNILTNPEALPEEALLAVTKSKSSKDDESHRKFSGI